MLTEYIKAAMSKARFELLSREEGYVGTIPGFRGVWANEDTVAACRKELQSVLEDWILVGVRLGHKLPVVGGINLNARKSRAKKVA